MKPPMLYISHAGQLWGTERMALATLQEFSSEYTPVLLAPPGPVHAEAQRMGIGQRVFHGRWSLFWGLRSYFAHSPALVVLATGVVQSVFCEVINTLYRRRLAHLHAVHGGSHDERHSFGRKYRLARRNIWFVAVSEFVRQRLVQYGVPDARIAVIENFIPDNVLARFKPRSAFVEDGVKRIVVLSRLDPLKRVDLLVDAFDRAPELKHLEVRIFGSGSELEPLRARASARHPNIHFMGFSNSIPEELARADLLVHLCPREACPVTLLEATASGLPVLVPDQGGTAAMVEDGVTGFLFTADDADDLARRLGILATTPAAVLNTVVAAAKQQLADRYSASGQIGKYRALIARADPTCCSEEDHEHCRQ